MLKELKTQHRTIIQMVFSGFSNNEIAERLEMNPSSVSQIIRSPLGQAYLGGLNDKAQESTLDVRKKLTSLNKNALETFERILDPRQKAPHAVQATIAKDVLDRNGYKPPDKLNIDMSLSVKTDAEIDAEINALEASIKKTYIQDPIKEIAEAPTDVIGPVIEAKQESAKAEQDNQKQSLDDDPQIEEDYLNLEALVGFDDLPNFTDDLEELDYLNNLEDSTDQPDIPEELLNKVPVDLFNSRSKA